MLLVAEQGGALYGAPAFGTALRHIGAALALLLVIVVPVLHANVTADGSSVRLRHKSLVVRLAFSFVWVPDSSTWSSCGVGAGFTKGGGGLHWLLVVVVLLLFDWVVV